LKALIVADGDVPARADVDRLLDGAAPDVVIAADGGAAKSLALGFTPDLVVGDSDSLDVAVADRLRADGVSVTVHPHDKDESDTELAVCAALDRGADALLIVGAFGGARLEHTIANILLLAMPALDGRDVALADGASEVRMINGGQTLTIDGAIGDFVSLFALAPVVDGVTTDGLEFALRDGPITQGPARGLSNVMTSERASVTARTGRLLVVHTRNER
jgi:thiamine pyrophosphokinase